MKFIGETRTVEMGEGSTISIRKVGSMRVAMKDRDGENKGVILGCSFRIRHDHEFTFGQMSSKKGMKTQIMDNPLNPDHGMASAIQKSRG